MTNRVIEIHDSTLAAISVRDGVATLHFSEVYIHESAGRPGVDAGSGWVQEAMLRISDALVKRSFSEFPAGLSDGHLVLDENVLENEIPLSHKGKIEIRLESTNNETAIVTGRGAKLELIGDPKYLEEFRP